MSEDNTTNTISNSSSEVPSAFDASKWAQEVRGIIHRALVALEPALRAFGDTLQQLDAATYNSYLAAGSPYGEAREGRDQWLRELAHKAQEDEQTRKQWEDKQWEDVVLSLTLRAFFGTHMRATQTSP